jgi:multidrug resistance protein, MATE family
VPLPYSKARSCRIEAPDRSNELSDKTLATMANPLHQNSSAAGGDNGGGLLFGTSYRSQLNSFAGTGTSPIAAMAIAQDLEDDPEYSGGSINPEITINNNDVESGLPIREHSMVESYHRPSCVAGGPRGAIVPGSLPEPSAGHRWLSEREMQNAWRDERSLLRDNNLIPPKHPRSGSESASGGLGKRLSFSALRKVKSSPAEEGGITDAEEGDDRGEVSPGTEATRLLGGTVDTMRPYGGVDAPEIINKTWEEAVMAGKIHTTWQREAKTLAVYSRSLILTFLLQYSLTVSSVVVIGRLGKVELGAVSLASSTFWCRAYRPRSGNS